jgi:hypothetical protein
MSHAKQASKPKSRTKALTVVTVAGTLSLAAGASVTAVSPAGHMARANRASAITVGEQQITELRVATFYVFDNENTGRHGLQFVKEHRTEALVAAHVRSMAAVRSIVEAAEATEVMEVAAGLQAVEGPTVCK